MTVSTVLPPGPKPKYPFAHMVAFSRNLVGFLQEIAAYGDIAYVRLGGRDVFVVNHPDLVKDVLVTQSRNFTKSRALEMAKRFLGNGLLTSESDFHHRQRRLAQPAFHRERIVAYSRVMAEYADRMQGRWRDGQSIDIDQEMMRVALSIVAKTLFNTDVEQDAEDIGEALTECLNVFKYIANPFAEILFKFPLPSIRRFRKAKAQLDAVIYRVIAERRANPRDHGDLLSMLLTAQDEDDGGVMTDLQVRDEVMTLFLAGHETTANAMTWTWYLLAQHPQIAARLYEEVDSVLGGRLPGFDDLPRLPYTRMVFSEGMRLYPPVYVIGRRAVDAYALGDYQVPAGATIILSPYLMQRKAEYFPEPETFDPERWTPDCAATRPKYAYFPFGGGPRVCIGEQFAWAEGVLVMATIAQYWQMQLVPDHPVELLPLITLRPKHGIKVTLTRRVK